VSSEVLPEFREYERLSTTMVNAFLMPVMRGYLTRFEAAVTALGVPRRPSVMTSGGGVVTPAVAVERPVDTLFSGPSGGVSGAVYVAERAGAPNIITFDMGGTSTDVCVIQDGVPQASFSREIDGLPIRAAALDVHTVGAGGSSIAHVDAGGLLRVGPRSAGSSPGPACYARGGEEPTVTDANVVLGRLHPEVLLGGRLPIDAARARAAIEARIARPRGISVIEAAASILAVANANMAQAVRFVSVERGLDPRDFQLVAFGGAGPVHAAFVARELGIGGVLVPLSPGVLCAMGVLAKDMQMDFSRTCVTGENAGDAVAQMAGVIADLEARARDAFGRNGYDAAVVRMERAADVRYVGQNHELSVAVPAGVIDAAALASVKAAFNRAHARFYGYDSPSKAMEVVTFRLRATVRIPRHELLRAAGSARSGGLVAASVRDVFFEERGGFIRTPVHARDALRSGDRIDGPAIVEQMDATTVVPPGTTAIVDAGRNLRLRSEGGGAA
jgi:N-methylhydantoinase A